MGFIKGIIAIIKGKQTPNALAAGFALGAMLGLMPKGNLLGLIWFLLFFLTTADKPAALLATALFTPAGLALDAVAHRLGYFLLVETKALRPLWEKLDNVAIVPWTNFNNTVVLGQFLIGLVLALPLFFIFKRCMNYYQARLRDKANKLPFVQGLKTWRLYQWWDSI